MTQQAPEAPSAGPLSHYHRTRLKITVATVIAAALCYGVGRVVDVPHTPGESVSLLQQSNAMLALVAVLVLLVVNALIGSAIAGTVRRDAGLVSACLGLIVLTARGGPIAATLHEATSPGIFLPTLAVEVILLYVFVVLAWLAMAPLRHSHFLPPDSLRDGLEPRGDEPLGNKLLATAATAIGMLILMLLLAQTQDKLQVLAAVFFAAMLATAAAHSAFPVEPSIFYWVAPGIVAAAGYAYASANPGPWVIGLPSNPLAAPLPLDYAAAGPPGALLGYWMSRKWQRGREQQITPPAGPPMTDAHMPLG